MPKPKLGKKSKRLTCAKRYKIEKKVRQHNKKLKKAKESSKHKKSKKDPGVPNKCPFKDQILEEAERVKARREEERQVKMERRKKERQKLLNEKRNLEGIVSDATKRAEDFERQKQFVESKAKDYSGGKAVENSLKAYYSEVKKVIDEADVIIEVLDARDPLGSRCDQVEEAILGSGPNKKLILLLNKIDLVPKENVEKWLQYLRNEFPTVAFKASTQIQTNRLSHSKVAVSMASDDLLKSSRCLGAEVLMKLLSNYCRNKDIKTSITIGIVGFPNTGKSSVINSLKRSKACSVGSTPGVTKAAQTVQLDKHIKLLDSPGIVMATDMSEEAVILHNCVKLQSIEDPVKPVSVILSRIPKKEIMEYYSVPDYSDVNEFLTFLAKRNGKLKKGGVADIDKSAKIVLQDWNNGKIKYSTEPPDTYTRAAYLTTKIITDMNQEFDVGAVLAEEKSTLEDLVSVEATKAVAAPVEFTKQKQDSRMTTDDGDDRSSSDEEDEEDDEITMGKMGSSHVASKVSTALPGNQQINRDRKKTLKKAKKQQRKAEAFVSAFDTKMDVADDYDFNTDFK